MGVLVRRGPRSMVCTATLVLALSGAVVACGSDSNDQQSAQADEIARAKEEGRRQALNEQRVKAASEETKKLRREVNKLKKSTKTPSKQSAGSSTTGASSAPSASSSPGASCGDGLSVNSVTTCPFARNVRAAYEASGGATTLQIDSPVTGRSYTMRCSPGVTTVCSGGNHATVYIR